MKKHINEFVHTFSSLRRSPSKEVDGYKIRVDVAHRRDDSSGGFTCEMLLILWALTLSLLVPPLLMIPSYFLSVLSLCLFVCMCLCRGISSRRWRPCGSGTR